ncbi:MAG: hypothetical protein QME64_02295, partial [bacterium]|nr:hypothetical protein [bacterium]
MVFEFGSSMLYLFIIHYLIKLYDIPGLNLFRYITFRSAAAAFLALLISLLLGPKVIARLRRMKIGQHLRKIDREKGPDLSEMH